MKRYGVFLLLAACGAFGADGGSGDDDDDDSTHPPPAAGVDSGGASSGGSSGSSGDPSPNDAGMKPDSGEIVDGGGMPGSGPLTLVAITEWHAPAQNKIKIPIPSAKAGDLFVVVVNTDADTTPPAVDAPDFMRVDTATAGSMRTTVFERLMDGSEGNESLPPLSGTANAAVLAALYRGASGLGAVKFKLEEKSSKPTLTSVALPKVQPTDMIFLVTGGVVPSGDLTFTIPQGFMMGSMTSNFAGHGGFGGNALYSTLPADSTGFTSNVTRTATGFDAVSTLIVVKD